jgi:protein-disulfide isomerase
MRRIARCLGLSSLLLACAGAAPAIAEPPDPSGFWNGWVVYTPAKTEVEVTVELARRYDGAWIGTIDVPVQNVELMPLRKVAVSSPQVAFELVETSGTSAFSGQLTPDGSQIRGEMTEDGAPHPFVLDRKAGRASPQAVREVRSLADDGAELKALFDRESDKVRLIFLVSPTCPRCAIASRLLERYILDQISDDRVRVYVLWGPMLGDETEDAARKASRHMPDGRVVQFWTRSPELAKRLAVPLGLKETPAWDVFLLFPPGAHWTDTVPQPAYFMHQRGDLLPADRALDAAKLRDQVRGLLASGTAKTAGRP